MPTYYVRKTGNDSNAGTSAGAAWLTIGKALGASGISSGDTVYIGAGVYRETVTVNMTSATVETFIIGDVDGSNTGDAGEVQWTAHNVNDMTIAASSNNINLNGRDFLTIRNISFISRANAINIATGSTNITIQNCSFIAGHQGLSTFISYTTLVDNPSNLLIESCSFVGGSANITIAQTRPSAADIDVEITIRNCLFIGGGNGISFSITGGNSFKPGGTKIYNCSFMFKTSSGNESIRNNIDSSTTFPVLVYNCFFYQGQSAVLAFTSGQIVEDYNLILCNTPRVNVTAGAHSISDGSYSPLFYTGREYLSVGSTLKPFGMPYPGSPLLGFGNQSGSPTTDILGVTRPMGVSHKDLGTATAGGTKTLTDSGKTWGTNVFAGCTVKITSGTGSGQTKTIASNTATVLTVDGNWKTNPSTDSVYIIYLGAMSSSGTATAGTTTSLTDGNATWGTNMWQGYTLEIDGGTGSPQSLLVTSNTATVLSFATATAPDATSTYKLYRGTSENVINPGVGCYEGGLSAVKETTTVRTGSTAIKIAGSGYHDFEVPVSDVSTTITVYGRYDSLYSGTLPQMTVLNSAECGVSNATDTMTGAANTWEQLSLTFTPTSQGIVTIRVQANSTTPTGSTFFDDFDVT